MLRSLLIFVISFAVLATGFLLVWRTQLSTVGSGSQLTTATPVVVNTASSGSSHNGVGPTSRPWANSYENGRLVSSFNATEGTPQKDGSIAVDKPVAKFFMSDGQVVKLTGDDGIVYTDNGGPSASSNMLGGSTATPRNGKLHIVHIEVYPNQSTTRPTMVMDTDNIKFDNDTLRMFTDSYTKPDGSIVKGDEVPVTVRGDDFDFDGTGLTIRWNGRDGHLQLLEINHGKQMVIKNPSKMSMPGMPPAEPNRAALAMPWPDMLASADPSSVALVKKPPTPDRAPMPYRAVFRDNVHILEGPRQVALADTMTIDFLQGSQGPAKPAPVSQNPSTISPPKTAPTAEAPSIASPVVAPITLPVRASTKPANQPITIQWTGELLVTPLQSEPLMPLLPKQSVVQLMGSPAILTPEGAEVQAASVTYRTPDGAVRVESSPAVPVVHLTQTKGFSLTTSSLDYDPATSVATLIGPSALTVPLANQKTPMTVNWSQKGLLHTVVSAGQTQPSGVDQVDLIGDVAVAHPTFTLNSDQLHIKLAVTQKPHAKRGEMTTEPQLLTASGSVDCKLISPGKPDQGIRSDTLAIAMEQSPAGKPFPRKVVAEGSVYAFDSDQDQHLNADQLEIFLTPKPEDLSAKKSAMKKSATTNPTDDVASAVQMESLQAMSNVRAVMKDGSTADCDDLRVTTVGVGKQLVELSGDRGAKLANGKGSWLTGSVVHLAPARNLITVDGAGAMHTIESAASSTPKPSIKPTTRPATSRPVDISWTDSMDVDGSANTADIVGHVIVHSVDATGRTSTITGDQAHIDFADAPKSTTRKAKPPAGASAVGMGNKQLKRLTLTGNVHGESLLNDTDGKLLSHAELFGPQLIYTAADSKATIPGAGKLLVENHRPDHKPVTETNEGTSSQGKMKIVWSKQLVYDQTAQVITIDGDTHTRFQQDAQSAKPTEKDQPMQLDAQQLVVILKNDKTETSKPTTSAAADNAHIRLSKLTATGAVHFSAKAVDFDAHSVEYDPEAQLLTAKGTDAERGATTDADGKVNGSFTELIYDLQAQDVKSMTGFQGTMRP